MQYFLHWNLLEWIFIVFQNSIFKKYIIPKTAKKMIFGDIHHFYGTKQKQIILIENIKRTTEFTW